MDDRDKTKRVVDAWLIGFGVGFVALLVGFSALVVALLK
jgi:hypothetical protein